MQVHGTRRKQCRNGEVHEAQESCSSTTPYYKESACLKEKKLWLPDLQLSLGGHKINYDNGGTQKNNINNNNSHEEIISCELAETETLELSLSLSTTTTTTTTSSRQQQVQGGCSRSEKRLKETSEHDRFQNENEKWDLQTIKIRHYCNTGRATNGPSTLGSGDQ